MLHGSAEGVHVPIFANRDAGEVNPVWSRRRAAAQSSRSTAAPWRWSTPTARSWRPRRHRPPGLSAFGGQGAAGAAAGRQRRRRRARLTDEELALACASHSGEPAHVRRRPACWPRPALDAARSNAARTGRATNRRRARWPPPASAERAAQQLLRQACRLHLPGLPAGRARDHCAVLARLRRRRAPGDARGHRGAAGGHRLRPVARAARHRRLLDPDLRRSRCAASRSPSRASAPASALRQDHARAAARLRAAVAAQPFMVAGHGRFDTRVMERLGERVFCKVGAEAVFCAALPERGLGVAIKIDDGNNARAAEVVMAALIEELRASTTPMRRSCATSATCAAQLERHRGRPLARPPRCATRCLGAPGRG